ncbi:hypothetical protein PIPA1_15860 [Pelosinus sp. IPA-1]|nr:hypothetical protein PIPA1_15860 [Pelosinus sp. IPA-1]
MNWIKRKTRGRWKCLAEKIMKWYVKGLLKEVNKTQLPHSAIRKWDQFNRNSSPSLPSW